MDILNLHDKNGTSIYVFGSPIHVFFIIKDWPQGEDYILYFLQNKVFLWHEVGT